MKSLHTLIIHRDNDNYRNLSGWWSHPVPEFTWETLKVTPNGFDVTVARGRYDLIVLDDWVFGDVHCSGTPLAYVVVDSMRSNAQFKRNLSQARRADIVLLDSESEFRFGAEARKPCIRFAHCVSEKLFFPVPKTIDVAFLCWPTAARTEVKNLLASHCKKRGWSFLTGKWSDPEAYAKAIRSAGIVVHKAHVEEGRSWRVFDVMASNGCLVSSPLPEVSGDNVKEDIHYIQYWSTDQLLERVDQLMRDPIRRLMIANAGRELVKTYHTWSERAAQLRVDLQRELSV